MTLFHEIQTANQRIQSHILKTPLTYSTLLSEKYGVEIYLKNEHLQYTGSFKLRGALNKVLSLTSKEEVVAGCVVVIVSASVWLPLQPVPASV